MKILTTSLLMFILSMTTIMTMNASATEKESEVTTSSDLRRGPGHRERMDAHMEAMHAQMQVIHAEKDPEKRRILMEAHRQSMHEGMQMMHGSNDHGRVGMMHRGGNRNSEQGKGRMDELARMEHMEHRMDVMHKMMGQMMQHEDVMQRHCRN